MTPKYVEKEGGRSQRDNLPEIRPNIQRQSGGRKSILFPSKIEKVGGILDKEMREQVERVILVSRGSSLSWPLLYCSLLAQCLPQNFPNADFVDCSGLMDLVKLPEGSSLVSPDPKDIVAKFSQGWERSVTFHPDISEGPKPEYDAVSALKVRLFQFGVSANEVALDQPIYGKTSLKMGVMGVDQKLTRQKLQDKQVRLLEYLGFDSLPKIGEHNILPQERYSQRFRETIDRVRKMVDEQRGESRLC